MSSQSTLSPHAEIGTVDSKQFTAQKSQVQRDVQHSARTPSAHEHLYAEQYKLTVLHVIQESFTWTEQWYPVAVVADLDPGKPHATKLLGTLKKPI